MIYRIKEEFWSIGDDFSITDAEGNLRFRVDGHAFSWGDDLTMLRPDGREVARITQKLLSLVPRYRIYIGGEFFAEVVKEWSWFKRNFTLDVPGPNDYSIEGSFWLHEFEFFRGRRVVATVSKTRWSWTDSYGVWIEEGEDDVAILCACIVVDQVLFDGDDK
jgi:uncharacterized protein YxjI